MSAPKIHVCVVPAKAGTQGKRRAVILGPCFRRGDDNRKWFGGLESRS